MFWIFHDSLVGVTVLALRPHREAEEARNMTCRETGLPKSSISEVLAGKKPFSRQMLRKLADDFGVDVGVLAANI